MDPEQTWKDLCAAYNRREWSEVKLLAQQLLGWLDKGGFPPIVTPQCQQPELLRMLASAACRRFLRDANRAAGTPIEP